MNNSQSSNFSTLYVLIAGRSRTNQLEEEFKKNTVGLVSKDEYKRRLTSIYSDFETGPMLKITVDSEKKKDSKQDLKKKKKVILSFEDELGDQDEEKNIEPEIKKKRNLGKDPSVDTSFLPDKQRQEELNKMKLKLSEEFLREQEKIKEQVFEAKYTLWNGLNDIKTIKIRKYTTVGSFIDLCKKELEKEYNDIKQITVEGLMFVLDDCIIPFGYTFFELLTSKVKGGRGLLIEEKEKEGEKDVFEQISKAGKIVDRRVYEKEKHIFPCNTWKILDFASMQE